MQEKLCVIMPVYNEQDAIGQVLQKWAKALDALHIDYIIRPYNDGSKDNSLAVMKAVAAHLSNVEVRDKSNGGHGNTILTGYREAADDGFDWIFQVDSDDEMGPEKFKELWSERGNYDFLVGTRDARIQALPRKIISFVSRLCVRIFYGKSVWDVNTPYRLMRTSVFQAFYKSIPLTTFAPNVILSGLAAQHNLRSFEVRVPQHDRTTGEVSIKKWKLLKAAFKSFCQTIKFSFRSKRYLIGTCVASLLTAIIITTLDFTTAPWVDECGTADTAVNLLLFGKWQSHVWLYSYNPLHLHLLTIWLWLFGISHMSVCSLGVVTGLILFCVLQRVVIRRFGLYNGFGHTCLALIYFGGLQFFNILTAGRIDLLVALFTVLVVDVLVPKGGSSVIPKSRLFMYSLLLMLSGVYSIPLVLTLAIILIFLSWKDLMLRKRAVKCLIIIGTGLLLGFILSCCYYLWVGSFFRFIHTFYSYNSTLSGTGQTFAAKWVTAYTYDLESLIIYVMIIFLMMCCARFKWAFKLPWIYCIGLIPILGKYSGRYEWYYSWLFSIPVILLLAWIVSQLGKRWLIGIFIITLLLPCIWIMNSMREWKRHTIALQNANERVNRSAGHFKSGENVIINDYLYYYPVVRKGGRVVKMSDVEYNGLKPREKFQNMIKSLCHSEKWENRWLLLFDKFERSYQKPSIKDSFDLREIR